jgi:hypothetical protein
MGIINKKIIIIEDFLPNLNFFLNNIYEINTYNLEEFNKKFNLTQNWPGERSDTLDKCSPFLFYLIIQNLNKIEFLKNFTLKIYLHLRTEIDLSKDWIHKDEAEDYAFLIYLNKDNFNAGTYIYNDKQELVADIKYVQNRLVMYNANYFHAAYGCYGSDEKNGRLAITGFVKVYDNK